MAKTELVKLLEDSRLHIFDNAYTNWQNANTMRTFGEWFKNSWEEELCKRLDEAVNELQQLDE